MSPAATQETRRDEFGGCVLVVDQRATLPLAGMPSMSDTPSRPAAAATILLVEDNDIYRQVVCAALQKRFPGWEILTAATLDAAGKFIGAKTLNVVITDLSLPDGSGVDLLPLLEADLKKGTKLIALTNDSPNDVLEGLKRRGYDGFVAKEHGISALCEGVKAVIAGHEFVSRPS
jgi:DNA-binding NarL/FixJ family response regulator